MAVFVASINLTFQRCRSTFKPHFFGLFFGCWAFQAVYVRLVHVCHEAGFFHHFFESLPSVLILLAARAVQWLCVPALVM